MIDKLKSMAIFATIADEGSFRGAAKKLGISPAIVSVHMKSLEEQLGAPLLYRSTRRVTLTDEGKRFYDSAKAMVEMAKNGLGQFAEKAPQHLTELRVAMPDTLTVNPIMNKISAFARNHVGVRLNLMSTDRQQNLIGEGHDVAIRMGYFKDSDLKMKRIGQDQRVVVAAPDYISSKAPLSTPEELKLWDFISFSLVPDRVEFVKGDNKTDNVWGQVIAKASSAHAVHALCRAGLGVAALPYHLVKCDLENGLITQLLPTWTDTKILPIYLVWISNADLSHATREFINFISSNQS